MFFLDSQRTVTRRDSSLITERVSLEISLDHDIYSFVTSEYSLESRARGSVQKEIVSLFFDSMLKGIVDTWETLEIKEKKIKKPEKIDRAPRTARKSKATSVTVPMIMLNTEWWSAPDERAVIHFKNGNVYEGDISWKCMHGQGRFQWADGTVYVGEFKENEITGRGTIEWKDNTWYTGEFCGNVRNGRGLFVDSRCQRCYSGGWVRGTKHGQGVMYHSGDFNNFYDGEWNENKMHGNGVRQYCTQSAYIGDFEYAIRQGNGASIFSNHDFYRGKWKDGIVDANGYYVWNTYRNETMSMPNVVAYQGSWLNGMRHDNGVLHFGPGLVSHYKGLFNRDQKQGKGIFVTLDGLIVSGETLFETDFFNKNNSTLSIPAKSPRKAKLAEKITLLCDNTQAFRYHIENAVKKHEEHKRYERVRKVNNFMAINGELNGSLARYSEVDKFNDKFSEMISQEGIDFEDRCLRLAVIYYERKLNDIYHMYSKICNREPIHFSAVLIRLYFWQFCYDCNFHEKGLNLTQIDDLLSENERLIINDPHYPFERIYRWQFVHSLLTLACHFYVGNTFPGPKPDTIVATAFCYFMDTDVLPNVGTCKGNLVKNNCVPMQATYELYLSLDEPRTVRKFLCAAKISPDKCKTCQPPLINVEEEHVPYGKNCYLFGDEMIFVEDKTHGIPRRIPYYGRRENLPLFNFGNLSSKCIIEQFANIVPNLMSNGKIIDIEKEITFYEFFEAFIACTEESIRKDEDFLTNQLERGAFSSMSYVSMVII